MNDAETILFVGGGLETLPGVETAKSMGLRVIVSDINPEAPCVKIADHFILADTYNVDQTLVGVHQFVTDHGRLDAVMCLATDVPLTVASVAAEFELMGIPVSAAKAVSDKIIMKDLFHAKKLPVPWYSEVNDVQHLYSIREQKGLPLIIKPVDSRGARGVLRITRETDLDWAFDTALGYSPTNRVMIERYLDGPQISTEALVIDGKVYTLGVSDRNYEFLEKYSPHIIENGGSLPSNLPPRDLGKVVSVFEKTAGALGIQNGVIKGDMVLHCGEPFIIEVAARLSGGYFCSHEIPLNTGVDFVAAAIGIALGRKIKTCTLEQKQNTPVAQRYLFPQPGRVTKINYPDWIHANDNIKFFEMRCKVGDVISDIVHHPSRGGLVITTGETTAQAISLAEDVVRAVEINTLQ